MTAPPLTCEIRTGISLIHIYGRRCAKGWNVRRITTDATAHIGHRPSKDKALRLAFDAILDQPGTYQLTPATS